MLVRCIEEQHDAGLSIADPRLGAIARRELIALAWTLGGGRVGSTRGAD